MLKSILCVSLVTVLCVVAFAQMRETPPMGNQPRTEPGAMATAGQAETLQTHLAVCLVLGNHEEVVLGQIAENKAQNDRVKEFARMMVKDHQQALTQLQRMIPAFIASRLPMGRSEGMRSDPPDDPPANRGGDPPPNNPYLQQPGAASEAQPAGERASAGSQLLDIEMRASQNRISLMKDTLSKMQGMDFDRAYVGCQVGMHTDMLAKLMAIEPYVSGDMKQMVHNAQEETKQHLEQAKKIWMGVQGESHMK
jgi:predicted outer membrane protein